MTAVLEETTVEVECTTEQLNDAIYKPGVNVARMRRELAWLREQEKLDPETREWNQGIYFAPVARSRFNIARMRYARELAEQTGEENCACCVDTAAHRFKEIYGATEPQVTPQMCLVGHVAYTDRGEDYALLRSGFEMTQYAAGALGISTSQAQRIAGRTTVAEIQAVMEDAAGAPL